MIGIVATTAHATPLTATQHLHGVAADLGAVAVCASFLVLPFARLQAALDVDRAAFAQVFAGDFRKLVEQHHRVPLSEFFFLAGGFVLPGFSGGESQIAHG